MENKLVLACTCLLDQCLTGRYMVIRATWTSTKPDSQCVGEHDLESGFISLAYVGRERIFRTTDVREELVQTCHLKARVVSDGTVQLREGRDDTGRLVAGNSDERPGDGSDRAEHGGVGSVEREAMRDDEPGSSGLVPAGPRSPG